MGARYQGHAGSIEGRYRSPQHWDPVNPKPEWLLMMNEPDAVLVNRAYSRLSQWAMKTIRVLWLPYRGKRLSEYQKAKELGCHYTELYDKGLRAKSELASGVALLERTAKIGVLVADNLVTVKDR